MSEFKKCIIWDLDNTLWDGICLEGNVTTRPKIRETITELDKRGIIHSIASKGEEDVALKVLHNQQLSHFFVIPKINWLPKTTNILDISRELNISLDSLAFVDDDPFEIEQVEFMLPDVEVIPTDTADHLLDMEIFNPCFKTKESKSRRQFYQSEEDRKRAEKSYANREDFLNSCDIKLSVRPMMQEDIPRVSELMSRTHQMNTTGQIFNKEELLEFVCSHKSGYTVFVAELAR
jgi:FkbH-like protein